MYTVVVLNEAGNEAANETEANTLAAKLSVSSATSQTMTGEYVLFVEDAMQPTFVAKCRPAHLFLRIYGGDIIEMAQRVAALKERTRKQ